MNKKKVSLVLISLLVLLANANAIHQDRVLNINELGSGTGDSLEIGALEQVSLWFTPTTNGDINSIVIYTATNAGGTPPTADLNIAIFDANEAGKPTTSLNCADTNNAAIGTSIANIDINFSKTTTCRVKKGKNYAIILKSPTSGGNNYYLSNSGTQYRKHTTTNGGTTWELQPEGTRYGVWLTPQTESNFTYTPSTPLDINSTAPTSYVDFNNTSLEGDYDNNSFNWYINETLVSTDENFTHGFTSEGDHNVTLIVKNTNNESDQSEQTISMNDRTATFTFTASTTGILIFADTNAQGYDSLSFSGQTLQVRTNAMPEGITTLVFNSTTDKNQTYEWDLANTDSDLNELLYVQTGPFEYIEVQVTDITGTGIENAEIRIKRLNTTNNKFELINQFLSKGKLGSIVFDAKDQETLRITVTKDGYTATPMDIETEKWIDTGEAIQIVMLTAGTHVQGDTYNITVKPQQGKIMSKDFNQVMEAWTETSTSRIHLYKLYTNSVLTSTKELEGKETYIRDLNFTNPDANYALFVYIDGNLAGYFQWEYDKNESTIPFTGINDLTSKEKDGPTMAIVFFAIIISSIVGTLTEKGLTILMTTSILAMIILPSQFLLTGIIGLIYFAAGPIEKITKTK